MPPSPILPHSINIVLQYISPPSQLGQPLPPHIISKSLLQRHHFLQISTDDPEEYLCWPSPARHQSIQLLESFLKPLDDDEYATYPIHYTSDDEFTYAHVRITPELRIIFQWDNDWRYHDATVMPFPAGSHSSLQDALSIAQGSVDGHRQTSVAGDVDDPYGSDDDAYWNAYGMSGDDKLPSPRTASLAKDETGEDAYWAQYASVQGSGDSTLPSPLPSNRRKLEPLVNDNSSPARDEPILFSYSSMHPRTRHSNLEPPSPNTLEYRLHNISPRQSRSISPPPSGADVDSGSDTPSPHLRNGSRNGFDTNLSANDTSKHESNEGSVHATSVTGPEDDNLALKESIRGVYRLWKAGRRKSGGTERDDDSQLFVRIVEEAIAS